MISEDKRRICPNIYEDIRENFSQEYIELKEGSK